LPFVATAEYERPFTRVKVTVPPPLAGVAFTPVGFGGSVVVVGGVVVVVDVVDDVDDEVVEDVAGGIVVVVVGATGAVYDTRTVGVEKVNPDARMTTASAVTSTDVVAFFVVPSVSKTFISNFDVVPIELPHRQRAMSMGTRAS
jgi:hypothetical protein